MLFLFRRFSVFGYRFNVDWVVIATAILLPLAWIAYRRGHSILCYGLLAITAIVLALGFAFTPIHHH